MKAPLIILALALAVSPGLVACDSDGDSAPASGIVSLQAEEGVDFTSGTVQSPGSFGNSDLYATTNGDALRLSTGGETSTKTRPASWLKTGGGIYIEYASLAEVPDGPLPTESGIPLPKARTGYGFIVATAGGGFTKGWVQTADASQVVIHFAPVEDASTP